MPSLRQEVFSGIYYLLFKMRRNSIGKASTFKLYAARVKFQEYLENIEQCPVAQKFPSMLDVLHDQCSKLKRQVKVYMTSATVSKKNLRAPGDSTMTIAILDFTLLIISWSIMNIWERPKKPIWWESLIITIRPDTQCSQTRVLEKDGSNLNGIFHSIGWMKIQELN